MKIIRFLDEYWPLIVTVLGAVIVLFCILAAGEYIQLQMLLRLR